MGDHHQLSKSQRQSTDSSDVISNSMDQDSKQASFRIRTNSFIERIAPLPYETGYIKMFDRSRGHGTITPAEGSQDLFLHIKDIMSEYIPRVGDFVRYKTIPIPPKNIKYQAVDVHFIEEDESRQRWDGSKHHSP